MRVELAHADQELARRVAIAVDPLVRALERHHEPDHCTMALAPGVLCARFWARDGTPADIAVGVSALAMATASGKIDAYARFMVHKALQQIEAARARRRLGLILAN